MPVLAGAEVLPEADGVAVALAFHSGLEHSGLRHGVDYLVYFKTATVYIYIRRNKRAEISPRNFYILIAFICSFSALILT